MLLYVLSQLVNKRILDVNIINDLLINIYKPIGYLYFLTSPGQCIKMITNFKKCLTLGGSILTFELDVVTFDP